MLDPKTGDIASLVDKRTGHDFVNASVALRAQLLPLPARRRRPGQSHRPDRCEDLHQGERPGAWRRCWSSPRPKAAAGSPAKSASSPASRRWKSSTPWTRSPPATRKASTSPSPSTFPDATARMDIPWGVMNPLTDQLPGANKNWLACQRWIDVSSDEAGVTWVPIEAAIVQFGDITANLLGARCRFRRGARNSATRAPSSPGRLNNHWHTNFPLEQGGVIPFRYAILLHGGLRSGGRQPLRPGAEPPAWSPCRRRASPSTSRWSPWTIRAFSFPRSNPADDGKAANPASALGIRQTGNRQTLLARRPAEVDPPLPGRRTTPRVGHWPASRSNLTDSKLCVLSGERRELL